MAQESHKLYRKFLKHIDSVIENTYIWPIKYPGSFSFVKKLLNKKPTLPKEKLIEAVQASNLFRFDTMEALINAKGFEEGLPEAERRLIIYERISLKLKRQLNFSQDEIDSLFQNYNNGILAAHPDKLVPADLFNTAHFKKLDDEKKGSIAEALVNQINYYQNKPGREFILIEAIRKAQLIGTEIDQKLLENAQQIIVNRLKQSHNKRKSKPKDNLTEYEEYAISILKKVRSNPEFKPNIIEKRVVTSFFDEAISNKQFNKRLGKIISKEPEGEKKQILEVMYSFSYQTRLDSEVNSSIDRAESILKGGKGFISKEELGALEVYRRISNNPAISEFQLRGLIQEDSKTSNLLKNADRSKEASMVFDEKLEADLNNIRSGDIIAYSQIEHSRLRNHKIGFVDKVQLFVTPYMHAAIGLSYKKLKGNKIKTSEIYEKYYRSDIDSSELILTADIYRIFPDKLITNDTNKKVIAACLGIDESSLSEKLAQMYQSHSVQLNHMFSNETEIDNPESRRISAGLADFIPFGHSRLSSFKKWASDILDNPTKIVDKITDDKGNSLICSEFAAKMTVLSLLSFERELVKLIHESNPTFKIPKGGLIKLPFSEHENLNKIHPKRLVELLKKSGAVEKVEVKNSISSRVI